jgi:hypothetical protein
MEGIEDYPTLVAVINNPRDMEIARTEGWYRIPVKHAPQRLGADYLAFYQTGAFGEGERWRVNFYAPVRRVRRVRRRDLLPDEPDHPRADDEYYKFELGPLARLPRPIPSRRLRRITFIPTTLKRLLSAQEINDLWLGHEVASVPRPPITIWPRPAGRCCGSRRRRSRNRRHGAWRPFARPWPSLAGLFD